MNSLPFLFEAMKETHDQHKSKMDIDELITGPTNITLFSAVLAVTSCLDETVKMKSDSWKLAGRKTNEEGRDNGWLMTMTKFTAVTWSEL
jgi:hypothetical protein